MNEVNAMQKEMNNIVEEGKQNKSAIAGHKEAIDVYLKHEMKGPAMLVQRKVEELENQNKWLLAEYNRLKNELKEMPF